MTELEILVRQAITARRPESRDAAMLNLVHHIRRLDEERKHYKDQIVQARQMGLSKLFVLTTRSIHWFQERGFTPVDIDLLPESKKEMYNYQRRSKVLMADLG